MKIIFVLERFQILYNIKNGLSELKFVDFLKSLIYLFL